MKFIFQPLSFLVCLAFFMSFHAVNAQEQEAPKPQSQFWKNVRFGGGLGLNFGNRNTQITVAPNAIYEVNPYFAFGPGLIYSYQKNDFLKTSLYGASITALANPIEFLQISGELEQLRVNQTIPSVGGDIEDDFWNTALFLGGGFRTGGVTIGARYNVLFNDRDSIYAQAWQPFVRVYF